MKSDECFFLLMIHAETGRVYFWTGGLGLSLDKSKAHVTTYQACLTTFDGFSDQRRKQLRPWDGACSYTSWQKAQPIWSGFQIATGKESWISKYLAENRP